MFEPLKKSSMKTEPLMFLEWKWHACAAVFMLMWGTGRT